MSPVRALSSYLLSPRRSRDMPRPRSFSCNISYAKSAALLVSHEPQRADRRSKTVGRRNGKFKLRLSSLPRRDPSRARDPCALRSRAPACPKLRQTARAERSPRAAHEHAARDQPLRRTRSGSTKTGSHTSTSTSPPRTTRDERAAPRSSNCGWPSGVSRFTIAESKAFLYIYAPFAIELALRFRPFKIKNATGPFSRTRKIRIGPRE